MTTRHGKLGVLFFNEMMISCITKVMPALDTKCKWKKEQSEVQFFWSLWLPTGPTMGRIITVQIPRSLLKEPVRFKDLPGTFPSFQGFDDDRVKAPHPGPQCGPILLGTTSCARLVGGGPSLSPGQRVNIQCL